MDIDFDGHVHTGFTFSCTGEPFTQEELEEMMSQAMDPEKGYIPYKDYASLMAAEESWCVRVVEESATERCTFVLSVSMLWCILKQLVLFLICKYVMNKEKLLKKMCQYYLCL